jgi:DNA replication protein DnaC
VKLSLRNTKTPPPRWQITFDPQVQTTPLAAYQGQLMSLAYEQQASTALQRLGLAIAEKQLDQTAQQAAAAGWSYTHFLGYLLEAELRYRHEKTVRLNLMFANLPYQKRLDTFDFHQQPSIDKRLIDELATGRFLHEGRNVVFLGPPGGQVASGHCSGRAHR